MATTTDPMRALGCPFQASTMMLIASLYLSEPIRRYSFLAVLMHPFEIAQGLGIVVYDDCEGFGDLKGMYCRKKAKIDIFKQKLGRPNSSYCLCA